MLILLCLLLTGAMSAQAARMSKILWDESQSTAIYVYDEVTYSAGDTFTVDGTTYTVTSTLSTLQKNSNVQTVIFDSSYQDMRLMSTRRMFYECYKLSNIINLQYLNTSEVTDMSDMFGHCGGLTTLDVTHFDTSKVRNMARMFDCCTHLTAIDVSNFDTSHVTSMNSMFSQNNAMESLDLSNFDTSNVTDMGGMF